MIFDIVISGDFLKRLFIIILILILFSFCGCGDTTPQSNTSERKEVTINLPSDNTVCGYRTGSILNSVSDIIDANLVGVESKPSSKSETSSITPPVQTSSTNNPTTQSNVAEKTEYCANLNSKVFHKSDCGSVKKMKEENKFYTKDRSMLTEMGYSPCNSCNP